MGFLVWVLLSFIQFGFLDSTHETSDGNISILYVICTYIYVGLCFDIGPFFWLLSTITHLRSFDPFVT